eukprot:CAMPEP_0116845344 /NCGR_PEP_ID=MMETSP0418-20121206/13208_1 /TAXON_ID=1158023 /ORGANISM="Astrosyne radiata, Strain 13vi08-1A" /LENGTH=136 /DNA_ID=CAMNT_0004476431 /DNA_START=96 /DNA_END=506 /DNA_ORIENTATION=+
MYMMPRQHQPRRSKPLSSSEKIEATNFWTMDHKRQLERMEKMVMEEIEEEEKKIQRKTVRHLFYSGQLRGGLQCPTTSVSTNGAISMDVPNGNRNDPAERTNAENGYRQQDAAPHAPESDFDFDEHPPLFHRAETC